jgi:hypothetical protein
METAMKDAPTPGPGTIGVHAGIANETYHSGPGISKSGLWTIYTRSPAHYKFAPRKESNAFDIGEAAHIAILEPNTYEARVQRGPEDRRGNKWTDAKAYAEDAGKLLLTGSDYDKGLLMRDAVHADARINAIITGGAAQVEHSGFWIDEETGALCKCRPDLYRPDLGIMLDLKSTVSAHPDDFARSVINYGYHTQEAWYAGGYRALGQPVEGFVFLAVEKTDPFVCALYELPPSIVAEGYAIARKALARYAECAAADQWPGYSGEITELTFKRWSYQETQPDMEEAA